MNTLINYLLNYALKHGISFATLHAGPYDPSLAFHKSNRMVINYGWHDKNEIPFIIGHEIGHLMNNDSGTNDYYYDCEFAKGPKERRADLYSLNLIYNYAEAHFNYFEEPGDFMQQYGIPARMLKDVTDLFNKNNDLIL